MEPQRRQSLPFGCMTGNTGPQTYVSLIDADDPHGVHGIGLPNFMNSHPVPPGQPLLSEQESTDMNNFFSGFSDEGRPQHHPQLSGQFQDNMSQLHSLQMPQTYVGHETYVREPQNMEWHPQPIPNYQFGGPMDGMGPLHTPTSPHTNGHVMSPMSGLYSGNTGSMVGFSNQWHSPFPTQSAYGPRPDMQFGSDHHFSHHGYENPNSTDMPIEADLNPLNYALAPASSTNTQPNSRANSNPNSNPNTEPSSPVAIKRRKLNAFQSDNLRMTSMNGQGSNSIATRESSPPTISRKHSRKPSVKQEQLPTPLSKTPSDEIDELEEDAEYDEDAIADPTDSPPAPWPSSKQRPDHKPALPPKPPKASRKKSQAIAERPPKTLRRASSSATNLARTPLTAEQKKQNHTNSEQRRRDATARSYAELYDRVPELEEMGKQSTMKRLEMVVAKVRKMKARAEYLENLTANGSAPQGNGHIIQQPIGVSQYPEMGQIPSWN